MENGKPDVSRINTLKDVVAAEEASLSHHGSKTAIGDLLVSIFSNASGQLDETTSINPVQVQAAYAVIARTLGVPPKLPEATEWTTQVKKLLVIKGSFVIMAIATVASALLNIPLIILQPTSYSRTAAKSLHQSILILSENQINELSVLRSRQYNFRGAVLVVSSQSFPALKQKYRILTCGQHSHDAFLIPWYLDTLRSHLDALLPLQPENLRLWQQESQEFEQRNQEKIHSCQTQLNQLKKMVHLTSEDLSNSLTTIEGVVGDLRIHAKFACHMPVQLLQESTPRPIKDHFEQALADLQKPGQYPQPLNRLEQALDCLNKLLISSVEPPSYCS